MENLKPLARLEEIVVREVGNEVLVYDLRKSKAYCLTESAAFIWNNCDGNNSVEQIREKVREKFGSEVSKEFVLLALEELNREGLLENPVETELSKVSRREALRKVGLAAVIALPLVASLSVPNTALASASCFGQFCINPSDCSPPCTTCSGQPGSGGTCI
jgi:hypothetical protein